MSRFNVERLDPRRRRRRARRSRGALAVLLAVAWLAAGCAAAGRGGGPPAARAQAVLAVESGGGFAGAPAQPDSGERLFVRHAMLRLDVSDVEAAERRAVEIAEAAGGYVESTDREPTRSRVGLRVPADGLDATLDALAALGSVRHRNVSASDVTEQAIDLEARLRNQIAVRDRLRALLGRADRVEDLLKIETELGRIQAQIDSLEGRLERLRERVALAAVELVIERERVLGPLGVVAKGVFWALKKLFVLR